MATSNPVNLGPVLAAQTATLVSEVDDNQSAINATKVAVLAGQANSEASVLASLAGQSAGFRKMTVLNQMNTSTQVNRVIFTPAANGVSMETMLSRNGAGYIHYMYAWVRQEIEIFADGVLVLTKDYMDGGGGSQIVGSAFMGVIPYSVSIEVKVRNTLSSQDAATLQHIMTE
jgi:hypothetical protein